MLIQASTSPLLKMSFETAGKFLSDATLYGHSDNLMTPSSRIVIGRSVTLGTGSFDLLHALDYENDSFDIE